MTIEEINRLLNTPKGSKNLDLAYSGALQKKTLRTGKIILGGVAIAIVLYCVLNSNKIED